MYEILSFFLRKQRNEYAIPIRGSSIFLLMLLLTIPCSSSGAKPKTLSSHKPAITAACKDTHHQAACEFVLSFSTGSPENFFHHSVQFVLVQARSALTLAHNESIFYHGAHTHLVGSINDCVELLDDTIDQLTKVLNPIDSPNDVQTWLSAALTNQETCLDSLKNYYFEVDKGMMVEKAQNLSHFVSNSLALYMSSVKSKAAAKRGQRLLGSGFPTWLSRSERKLLKARKEEIAMNAVVAKDGTGTHNTIAEALGVAVSLADEGRTVIYVKAGTYRENLKIPTSRKNVMLVGDGMGKTVIVSDRNSQDGWTTFQSATVAAMGDGFIARDITFVNSAGPDKNQAVALRIGSDKSVVFRCAILGYQDTLYTHSKRQFYRETDIYGTVDFIFGNSAVVFQSCNIYVRKPVSGQHNFITAQGRKDPNQNTGISIHNCKISATEDLAPVKSKFPTFLGRPWQKYSRTVIMQSFLDGIIHPLGWAPWSGDFALENLYYGEYMNSGPGASTSSRVKWSTYHPSMAPTEAQKFTVGSFISGNLWLPSTGVSFDSGLLG